MILGFSFGAPALLSWMVVASVPIIIHLLHRRRHKTMDWAAMKWLLAALKKNRRWIQIEQWLLLALRTLILVLVVLAMAKPAWDAVGGLFTAMAPACHHVLVLDATMSMQSSQANVSRWDRAKEVASSILDGARQGDFASVLLMGSPPDILVGEASPYLVAVAEEIDSAKPHDGVGRIDQTLDAIERILRASPTSNRRVYFITDMQRSAWLGREPNADSSEVAERLAALQGSASFTVLDVGGGARNNLAVTEFKQLDPIVVRDRPTVLRATVSNFGKEARSDLLVELRHEGEVEASQRLSVDAGSQASVTFAPTFSVAGDRPLELRIEADGLARDDSRWLVANVRDELSVAMVDGQPASEPFKSETDYLRVALAPAREDGSPSLVRLTMKNEADLFEEDMDSFDLIVLANVSPLTPGEAETLATYVRKGGGLLLYVGSQTDPEPFNRILFAEGKGLSPVQIDGFEGDAKTSASNRDKFHRLDPKDYSHPLVTEFRDAEQAGLLTTRVFRYARVSRPENSSAVVPLQYDTGDPAVVIGSLGQGRVGVVTTSADLDWNSWAVSPSFLPIAQRLVKLLSGGRTSRDDIRVGEPIVLSLAGKIVDRDLLLKATPPRAVGEDSAETARPEINEGVAKVSFAETARSGIYRVAMPIDDVSIPVAVNTWPAESDLTVVSEDELREQLPGWDFRLADRWESVDLGPEASPTPSTGGIHRPLLYAALALLLLEPLLAWRFSRTG